MLPSTSNFATMEEDITVISLLNYAPSGSCGGADKPKLVRHTVESLDTGVDVDAVARALGLAPSTVRLNGHLLGVSGGGGGCWVSSVTWKSLLAFFSSRGHPTGAAGDPIHVQGKLLSPGTGYGPCIRDHHPSIDADLNSLKRKNTTENLCQAKKRRSGDYIEEDDDNGSDILGLKRKLRLENEKGQKRAKTEGNFLTKALRPEAVKGLCAVSAEPSLCNSSCVAEHFKHSHHRTCTSGLFG